MSSVNLGEAASWRAWREEADLRALLETLRPAMTRVLASHSVPLEDAEDLLQEALFALVLRRDSLQDPAAWLYSVLRNRCRLYWRHRGRHRAGEVPFEPSADADSWPGRSSDDPVSRLTLQAALNQLPVDCREALFHYEIAGETSAELGERWGLSPEAARKRVGRIKARLRDRLRALGLAPPTRPPKKKGA